MGNVEFTDNRIKVEAALDDAVIVFLYEAAGEVEAQTKRAQARVDINFCIFEEFHRIYL